MMALNPEKRKRKYSPFNKDKYKKVRDESNYSPPGAGEIRRQYSPPETPKSNRPPGLTLASPYQQSNSSRAPLTNPSSAKAIKIPKEYGGGYSVEVQTVEIKRKKTSYQVLTMFLWYFQLLIRYLVFMVY
jgi:hypothetical protein